MKAQRLIGAAILILAGFAARQVGAADEGDAFLKDIPACKNVTAVHWMSHSGVVWVSCLKFNGTASKWVADVDANAPFIEVSASTPEDGAHMPAQPEAPKPLLEPNAILGPGVTPDVVKFLRTVVIASNFQCDSVSGALANVFSHGFEVDCDRHSLTYTVWNQGGHWVAEAKR